MLSQIPLSNAATVQSSRVLYTAGEFAKNNLIYLQESGTLSALKSHKSSRERLNSYLFFCVLSGKGKLYFGGETYLLKEGDCALIDCNQPYSHETEDNDLWRLVWFHFYGDVAKNIYAEYKKSGGRNVFQTASPQYYEEIQKQIATEAAKESSLRDITIFGLLGVLLSKAVSEGCVADFHNNGKRLPLLVREYLDANYNKKITLDELSDNFHINKYYLTRLFRATYGRSITDYLIDRRITVAKSLLRFTDDTAENIALSCGITDAGYFGRLFKRLEGETPGEYRARWK